MTRKSSKAANKPSQLPLSKPPSTKLGHTHNHIKRANKHESHSHGGLIVPKAALTYTQPPSNWPSSVPYLASNIHSPEVSTSPASLLLQGGPSNSPPNDALAVSSLSTYTSSSNPLIKLQAITNIEHPAHGQSGLFAARHIPPGTHIVDYTGLVHICPLPSCANSDYDLAFLDRDAGLAIDSAAMGNEGRFVNDYHGIRGEPNACFEEYWTKTKVKGKEVWTARMGIWCVPATASMATAKGITKDEEICVSYGKGWWRARRGVMEDALQGEDAGSPV